MQIQDILSINMEDTGVTNTKMVCKWVFPIKSIIQMARNRVLSDYA